jgi:polysaccharide biosynthesis/export protein
MRQCSFFGWAALLALSLCLNACGDIPTAGPRAGQVDRARAELNAKGIQLIDIDAQVIHLLAGNRVTATFADVLGEKTPPQQGLGPGDAIDITIWEAPPAALFGGLQADGLAGASGGQSVNLPNQVIDSRGEIAVPFVGRVRAAGLTPAELAANITSSLRGKANQPQVLVRLSQNQTSTITVVSDGGAVRVPFTPKVERVLDAITSAGAAHQQLDKLTVQIVRGNITVRMPLSVVVKDPTQNVPLYPGDTVAVLYQPYTFTALGATGKNDEVSFEAPGISLSQALARTGGLNDNRSDARGVFIFRMEDRAALRGMTLVGDKGTGEKVPVIYRIDLTDPENYFVARAFTIDDKDIVYVANAPIADLQKFLNVVFSVTYPLVNTVSSFK